MRRGRNIQRRRKKQEHKEGDERGKKSTQRRRKKSKTEHKEGDERGQKSTEEEEEAGTQ